MTDTRTSHANLSEQQYVLTFALWGGGRFESPSTKEEFHAIRLSGDLLAEVLAIEDAYECNMVNYVDLESGITRLIVADAVRSPSDEVPFHDARRTISRLLDNLLSSSKGVLDQLTKRSKMIGGSKLVAETRKLRDRARADLKGFRVMEALRNHAQHAGSSVTSISFQMSRSKEDLDDPDWQIIYSLQAFARTKDLSLHRSVPPAEKAEFQALLEELSAPKRPELINLVPLVRGYVLGIGRIVKAYRELIADDEARWNATQLDALARLKGPEAPNTGQAVVLKEGGTYRDIEHLSHFMIDRIATLRTRNGSLEGLQRMQIRH